MVGSCALAIFIHGNRCFTANVGDSKAVICRSFDNNTIENQSLIKCLPMNERLNASHKKEQERLIASFPNDKDIITLKVFELILIKFQ